MLNASYAAMVEEIRALYLRLNTQIELANTEIEERRQAQEALQKSQQKRKPSSTTATSSSAWLNQMAF